MDLPRRDVKISCLCHVATCIFTSRRQNHRPLSCRDVYFHVATSISKSLCHVAMSSCTSRRQIYRSLSRRDVDSNVVTSPSSALCHVATCPCTSRRGPVFSPTMVHFGPSPHTPSLIGTLSPLRPSLHRTCRSSHPTGRRPFHCSLTTVSYPLWPVLGHSGISTTVCPILAWVQ